MQWKGTISGERCGVRMGLFKMADFMTFLYTDGIVPGEKKKWIIHWRKRVIAEASP